MKCQPPQSHGKNDNVKFYERKVQYLSFFPHTFFFLLSNLGNAAPIFGKATFVGLSSRSCERCLHAWCRKLWIQNSQPCINLPCPTLSPGKVWKWIMQMTICCVPFVFFPLNKSELCCACTELVWRRSASVWCVHELGNWVSWRTMCFVCKTRGGKKHSLMMVFLKCNVCLVGLVQWCRGELIF